MRPDSQKIYDSLHSTAHDKQRRWMDLREYAVGEALDSIMDSRGRDAGRIVRGARKERGMFNSMLTAVGLKELELSSASEAATLTVKAKLWPRVDVQALKDSGFSPGVAYLIVQMHKMIAKTPSADNARARQDYLNAILGFQEFVAKLQTMRINKMSSIAIANTLKLNLVVPASGRGSFVGTETERTAYAKSKNMPAYRLEADWSFHNLPSGVSVYTYTDPRLSYFSALGVRLLKWPNSAPFGKVVSQGQSYEEADSWSWALDTEDKVTLDEILGEKWTPEALQQRGYTPGSAWLAMILLQAVAPIGDGIPYENAVDDLLKTMEAHKEDAEDLADHVRARYYSPYSVYTLKKKLPEGLDKRLRHQADVIALRELQESGPWYSLPKKKKDVYETRFWQIYHDFEKSLLTENAEIQNATLMKSGKVTVNDWIASKFERKNMDPEHDRVYLDTTLGSKFLDRVNALGDYLKKLETVTSWETLNKTRKSTKTRDIERPTAIAAGVTGRRSGGNPIPEDVTADSLRNRFALSTVEHGKWVKDDESDLAEPAAYGALTDLADAIGFPVEAIGMAGRIGLGIGSRGAGRFAAHYELGSKMINMTKTRGAGALAHEWGHAFDHYMGDNSASGGSAITSCSEQPQDSPMGAEVQDAMAYLVTCMYGAGGRDAMAREADMKKLKELKAKYKLGQIDYAEYQDQYAKVHFSGRTFVSSRGRRPEHESEYYKASREMGNPSYWCNRCEMFARAFESYVEDELTKRGQKSLYLVSDTGSAACYPQGDERKQIHLAIADLLNTMRPKMQQFKGKANPRRRQ